MCRAWVFRIVKLAEELRQTAHELDKRTTYKMPKKKIGKQQPQKLTDRSLSQFDPTSQHEPFSFLKENFLHSSIFFLLPCNNVLVILVIVIQVCHLLSIFGSVSSWPRLRFALRWVETR